MTEIERDAQTSQQRVLDHTVAASVTDRHVPEEPDDLAVAAMQPPSVPATFRLPIAEELGWEAEQRQIWLQEFLERHKEADDPSQWEDLSHLTPIEIVQKLSSGQCDYNRMLPESVCTDGMLPQRVWKAS